MGNLSSKERDKLYKDVLPKPSEIGDGGQIRWGLGLRVVVETYVAMIKEDLDIGRRVKKHQQDKVDRHSAG